MNKTYTELSSSMNARPSAKFSKDVIRLEGRNELIQAIKAACSCFDILIQVLIHTLWHWIDLMIRWRMARLWYGIIGTELVELWGMWGSRHFTLSFMYGIVVVSQVS